MDTTALLLAVCLGASSSRWQNDIKLWVVGAPTGNRFIDFLAVFFKSERDIAGERENGGAPLHGGPIVPAPSRRGFRRSSPLSRCASGPVRWQLPPPSPRALRPESGRGPCCRRLPLAASCSFGTNRSGAP